jgi:transposase
LDTGGGVVQLPSNATAVARTRIYRRRDTHQGLRPSTRPPRQIRAKRRYETLPGQQAQVDWGICEYTDVYGQRRKLAMFVMVLGYSRAMYVEFFRRCDIHSFLRSFVQAIQHFCGVPRVVLTDRMKTVLVRMSEDRTPKWHPVFEDFALSIGTTPSVCKPLKPQTKGKMERMIRFVKENFWTGRRFSSLAELNRQVLV